MQEFESLSNHYLFVSFSLAPKSLMVSIRFDPVYLACSDGRLASEWQSYVEIEGSLEEDEVAAILPPMKPNSLKV